MKPNRYSVMLMLGHFSNDICQGAMPAVIPFMVAERGLSITAAGGLMFALTFLSSIIQPVVGVASDRYDLSRLMGIGVLLTGIGIACVGIFTNYWAIFIAATFAGIGTALFHPEGGRMANRVAGDNKGAGVSIFSVGGNIGFAIGPIVALAAMGLMGIRGMTLFLIPTAAMAAVLLWQSGKMLAVSREAEARSADPHAARPYDDWRGFWILCVALFCRTIAANSLTTFIPLFWVYELSQPTEIGSAMLTLAAAMSAVGTLVGGRLADRFDYRLVIRVAMSVFCPLLFLLAAVRDVRLATILLIPMGISSFCAFTPMVVLAQKFLPGRLGFATGITLGLAVSIGGIAAPMLGRIGDLYGMRAVIFTIAAVSLVSTAVSYVIPEPRRENSNPAFESAG